MSSHFALRAGVLYRLLLLLIPVALTASAPAQTYRRANYSVTRSGDAFTGERGLSGPGIIGGDNYQAWSHCPATPESGVGNGDLYIDYKEPPYLVEAGQPFTIGFYPRSRNALPVYHYRYGPDYDAARIEISMNAPPGKFDDADAYIGYEAASIPPTGSLVDYNLVALSQTLTASVTAAAPFVEIHVFFEGGSPFFNNVSTLSYVQRWDYQLVTGASVEPTNIFPPPDVPLIVGFERRFSADVNYQWASDVPATLALQLVSPAGVVFKTVSVPIGRVNTSATTQFITDPIKISQEMEGVRMRAQILVGSTPQTQKTAAPYTTKDDVFFASDRTPSENFLTPGDTKAFAQKVSYKLVTGDSGELTMDLYKGNGEWISGAGPRLISKNDAVQTINFSLPALAITADLGSLKLRTQMKSGSLLHEIEHNYPIYAKADQLLRVVAVNDDVEVRLPGGDWMPLTQGMQLPEGAEISTGPDGTVQLQYPDESVLILKPLTQMLSSSLIMQGSALRAAVALKVGEVSAQVNPKKVVGTDFSVKTPVATTSVRGTDINVKHVTGPEPLTTLGVTDGTVDFIPENAALKTQAVTVGQSAQATATQVSGPGAPVITQVAPLTAAAGSTTAITITGSNFAPTAAGNVVQFGGMAATINSASATQLVVRAPLGLPAGTEPLVVTVNGSSSNAVNFNVTSTRTPAAVSGNIASVNWTRSGSPYLVSDATVPAGSTLQIEPGVVVMFASPASTLTVNGTLAAPGLATLPIRFTSSSAAKAPGQWGGIIFQDASDDKTCRMANCAVEYGGNLRTGMVECVSASPRFVDCRFSNGSGNGVSLSGSDPAITGCVFTRNAGAAVWLENTSFPTLQNNLAVTNGTDAIALPAQTLTRSGAWPADGIPWLMRGDINVAAGKTLTVAAGAIVRGMHADTDLIVEGALSARGTSELPITFTSDEPSATKARGQWGGITFADSSVDAECVLENCVIEYAGGGGRTAAVEMVSSAPALRRCTVAGASGNGVAAATQAVVADCTFRDCGGAPVRVPVNAFVTLRNNAATGNANNSIALAGGSMTSSGTWTRDGIPYRLTPSLTVAAGATLTIEPGTTIQFADPATDLIVNGALNAAGTASQPIRFTTDDAVPAAGQWGALVFQNASAPSALSHCVIEYGGASHNGALELISSSPLISDCVVQFSSGDGIFANNSATQLMRCSLLNNARDGIRFDGAGAFAVRHSRIAGNSGSGIRNLTTQVLDARSNYWGAANGPLDDSNADGSGRQNSGGGNRVSEYVDWTGFLTSWPPAPQTAADPALQIANGTGGNIIISWSADAAGATLQQSPDLNAWSVASVTTSTQNGRVQATIPRSGAVRYYRLIVPSP